MVYVAEFDDGVAGVVVELYFLPNGVKAGTTMKTIEQAIQTIKKISRQSAGFTAIYSEILAQLGLPDPAIKIAKGTIRPPFMTSPLGRPFPPALLPLWSTGSGTIWGYWKHWFSPERSMTIVEYYGETMFGERSVVFERARTFSQLVLRSYFQDIVDDGEVDSEISKFFREVGYSGEADLLRISQKTGHAEDLLELEEFRSNPPLQLVLDANRYEEYDGDFPCDIDPAFEAKAQRACSFEMHKGFLTMAEIDRSPLIRIAKMVDSPRWFGEEEKVAVFDALLGEGDLGGAWMCLNSHGWRISDAKKALMDLSDASGEGLFPLLAETWSAAQFDERDRY